MPVTVSEKPASQATVPVVYTRTTCAPCQTVKSFLKKKGVEYRELNVDEHPELMDEIVAKTGFQMVPTTIIGEQIIQGMNFALLNKALMV